MFENCASYITHFSLLYFTIFYFIIIIYYFLYFVLHQVLVCAPSNVAVDQLAEKISATGLKVKTSTLLILNLCLHRHTFRRFAYSC